MSQRVRSFAPGRVNLIGEHTDYNGGLAMPMAIDLGVTVEGVRRGDLVRLRSSEVPGDAVVPLRPAEITELEPPWARYVAGVVAAVDPDVGLIGEVRSSLPIGVGLSSSAALELALALALGLEVPCREAARICQRAEQTAVGVPCGIMDQLASAAGVEGHALLIDCATLEIEPVLLPEELEVVVVASGEYRRLAESAYGQRRAECEAAASVVGPLRDATLADLASIEDEVVRSRARHVLTENARVLAFAAAVRRGDLEEAGALLRESHASLRDDFAVSTPGLEALVAGLDSVPGVYGSRLTGAGFGGCAVALTSPGALGDGWRVRPSAGAALI
ncbi:MAG: galactokinase [Acidimicrobiales bacterium]